MDEVDADVWSVRLGGMAKTAWIDDGRMVVEEMHATTDQRHQDSQRTSFVRLLCWPAHQARRATTRDKASFPFLFKLSK